MIRKGYRYTDFPYLIVNSPNEVRAAFIKAYRVANYHIGNAAKLLGLSRTQFYNIMKRLNMTSGDLIMGAAKWAKLKVVMKGK